jgi:4-hydroxyphenylpyruvate dioxygenase
MPLKQLKEANILCEQDGDKILLQVFTEPIGDRPTLFYEFVQRVNNYDGFGVNNVHQLFRSLEIQINGES